MTRPTIWCLNAGSSSLKAALYRVAHDGRPESVWHGAEGGGNGAEALQAILDGVGAAGHAMPDVIAHRIVHGGPELTDHVRIDAGVLATLRAAVPFAPLHLPPALAVVDAVSERYPGLPQVACLDTAFHTTMPEVATRYALPDEVVESGVRRYGFHGLSYEYVVGAVGPDRLGRAVIAHLGNGASAAAIADGHSVDTTMGLTPTGGLVMGTRPGDLDPGVAVHLARTLGLGPDALEQLFDHRSGLLGLSGGRTNDVRELLALRAAGDPAATLALAVFPHSIRKAIGALAAVLGGLDTLVFTGGIGEHAAPVRADVVAGLGFLGLVLDEKANATASASATAGEPGPGGAPGRDIGAAGAAARCLVVPTDEEQVMADHAWRLVDVSPDMPPDLPPDR